MGIIKLWAMLLLAAIHIGVSNPEKGEKLLLNDRFEIIQSKQHAVYTAQIELADGHFNVKAFYLDGAVKMEGAYMDKMLLVPHGLFVYYHSNGQVESTGHFRNGSKYGIWLRYHADGSPKTEKIYATEPVIKAMEAMATQ